MQNRLDRHLMDDPIIRPINHYEIMSPFTTLMKDLDIGPAMLEVLILIDKNPGLSYTQLFAISGVKNDNSFRTIIEKLQNYRQPLARYGAFVRNIPIPPKGRRPRGLYVTSDAKKMLRRAYDRVDRGLLRDEDLALMENKPIPKLPEPEPPADPVDAPSLADALKMSNPYGHESY